MVKPIPKPTLISFRSCVLAGSAVWLLLGATGCGTADPNMFGSGQSGAGGSPSAGSLNISGSSGLEAGGNGGSGSIGGETSAGSTGYPVAAAGSGGSGAGCAFSCGDGGRGNGGSGSAAGSAGAGVAGDNAEAGSSSGSPECAALSTNATYSPTTQHCYLVDTEMRTFAEAQTHCKELNAHLITLSSEAENDFAWSMHSDEHWIGSQDGKMPKQSGVGKYTWVTNEPFEYKNWSPDQPNASMTDCVDGGSCYEHCAFQWKGGDHDSQWNDRYCMHTIVSICEWDSVP